MNGGMWEFYVELTFRSAVILCALIITLRAWLLYRLSHHRGIQLFGMSFTAAAVAYLLSIPVELLRLDPSQQWMLLPLQALYYFTLSLVGFLLAYSLVWRDLGRNRIVLIFLVSALVSVLRVWYDNDYFLYLPQLAVLGYAILLAYANYVTKRGFQQLYFIAIVLAFAGYLINFLGEFIVPFYPTFIYYIYGMTLFFFVLVLVAVVRGRGKKA